MRDNFSINPKMTFNSCLTLLTQHDTMFRKKTRDSQINYGRAGRGRHRGLGKVPETFKGTKITQIPDEEWYALTKEQNKKIQELRKEHYARNPRNRAPGGGTPHGGRPQRGGRTPGGGRMPTGGRRINLQETDRDVGQEINENPPEN